MAGTLIDNRTAAQKLTHTLAVGGKDRAMSGWGDAENGSWAYWACAEAMEPYVRDWVERRRDITRRETICADLMPRRRKGTHTHIYVVVDGHPALPEWFDSTKRGYGRTSAFYDPALDDKRGDL